MCSPMTSRPANAFGKRRSRDPSRGRVRPGGADRLERPCFHRQRRRRRQRRQGPHVRARRQNRQDRLGILPRAEGSRAIRRADPRSPRRSTRRLGTTRRGMPISGGATWTSYTLDPAAGELYVPVGQSRTGLCEPTCARATNLYSPARSSCSTPRPGPTSATSSSCSGTGTIGTSPARRAFIKTAGGKKLMAEAPKDGYLYGVDLGQERDRSIACR